MADPISAQDALNAQREYAKFLSEYESFNKRVKGTFKDLRDAAKQLGDLENNIFQQKILYQEELLNGDKELAAHYKTILDLDEKLLASQKKQINLSTLLNASYKSMEIAISGALGGVIVSFWHDLEKADASWKNLNKEIGLSGDRSSILRDNLIDASVYAAKIGVTFENLAAIQGSFTNELGNAVLLSTQSLKDLADVAAGTSMGAEQAGLMAAKFNLIGKSVSQVKDFYTDVINDSNKFGVSANVVIKKINENLEKSQQYVFKGGIDGLKNMAMYAAKFNVDMSSVFNAMGKSNSLEGAVDMAAQLQVIGGKFAQTDPFRLLFEARNDAEAFTKTMQGLTKGMATFNKTSGEITIAAGDLNRLKLAADATGMSYESLIAQAKKSTQISMIDKIIGEKMSPKQKEFIEGIAEIQKNGSFKVNLGADGIKDLKDLSGAQVNALMKSTEDLNQRAKDAQTFDGLLTNTLNAFKSSLLPILKLLDSAISGLNNSGLLTPLLSVGIGLAGVVALKTTFDKLSSTFNFIKPFFGKGGFKNPIESTISEGGGGPVSTIGETAGETEQLTGNISNAGNVAESSAVKMLAFGAAVIEIGTGIFIATKGIAAMAEAFKGLNGEQLIGINTALLALVGGIAGIAAIGVAAGASAPELLLFGGAILAIGGGIGIAAAGIGYMAQGFGSLIDSLSKVSDEKILSGLSTLVLSLSALGASSLLFSNPLAWIGLTILTNSIGDLADKISSANFDGLTTASKSFTEISNAIDSINDKKLDKLIEVSESLSSISSIASVFNSLNNLFGDGIEVKFKEQTLSTQINITNQIDSVPLAKTLSKVLPLHIEADKSGKPK